MKLVLWGDLHHLPAMADSNDLNQAHLADSAVLSSISTNAKSLLEDAELLFHHGRHARATALAILCVEEVGKYFLIKWRSTDWRPTVRRHRRKQQLVATFDQAQAACDSMRAIAGGLLAELVSTYKLEPNPREWLEGPLGSEFWDFVWSSDLMLNSVADAIKNASGAPVVSEALRGALCTVRNAGFYVDVDQGHVRSDPTAIDEKSAAQYLAYARSAVARMPGFCPVDKASEAIFKLGG